MSREQLVKGDREEAMTRCDVREDNLNSTINISNPAAELAHNVSLMVSKSRPPQKRYPLPVPG